MIEILVHLLVAQLCFLELSGDDVVNADSAVQQIESVVAELESLTDDDRARLLELLRAELAKARSSGQPDSRIKFIESLPDVLGLDDS